MPHIVRDTLMSLEAYAKARKEFRAKVIAHKRSRTIHLGEHVTLIFEDELTIRYQVQEMLRIEKIFEEEGIDGELAAYNPLIPDGANFKATMLIEYEDADLRRRELAKLKGIEDRVWMQVEGCAKVFAIADEDLERENAEKTSSVHFLRFEMSKEMVAALKYGVALGIGVDHPNYKAEIPAVGDETRRALIADLA
jgi:uncharacterized protein DUF3501